MPLFLRKIRKAKWYSHIDLEWLVEGEIQADALGDLATKNNTLSVWNIEDDKSNLEEVITALATRFDSPSNLDFALIDKKYVVDMGLKVIPSKGDTYFLKANEHWHFHLTELTAQSILNLANIIMINGEKERYRESQIILLLKQAIQNKTIYIKDLSVNLQSKIKIQ